MSTDCMPTNKIRLAAGAAFFALLALPWSWCQTGFAPVPGADLHYQIKRSGEPVILLHGAFIDSGMWDEQWEALSRRHRLVRFDQRNAGRSRALDTDRFDPVEDLRSLMEFLKIQRAHLVGLSLGGAVAVEFALAHPDRVCSLVLISSGLRGVEFDRESQQMLDRLQAALRKQEFQQAAQVVMSMPMMEPLGKRPAARERLRAILEKNLARTESAGAMELQGPMPMGRLQQIVVPTLVMVGTADTQYTRTAARTLARDIPAAQLKELPGQGHMLNTEQPDRFNALVAGS